jgi:hypothetical protein
LGASNEEDEEGAQPERVVLTAPVGSNAEERRRGRERHGFDQDLSSFMHVIQWEVVGLGAGYGYGFR